MLMKPGATARPRAIDLARGRRGGQIADDGDAVAVHRQVRDDGRGAAAVVHGAVSDDSGRSVRTRGRRMSVATRERGNAEHRSRADTESSRALLSVLDGPRWRE
jgi:hypothetical protein